MELEAESTIHKDGEVRKVMVSGILWPFLGAIGVAYINLFSALTASESYLSQLGYAVWFAAKDGILFTTLSFGLLLFYTLALITFGLLAIKKSLRTPHVLLNTMKVWGILLFGQAFLGILSLTLFPH